MQVQIRNEFLTVTIDEMGAQMLSIVDKDGYERLWNGKESYWKGRAPILFPIAGALKENAYYLDGKRYEMPKHGYVRNLLWKLEDCDGNSATFLITEKHPGFPFDYELRARYTLEGSSIRVTYQVNNTGNESFWYSVASHEGFATPGGISNYYIHFEKTECLERQILQGSLLTHHSEVIHSATDKLRLSDQLFTKDALVFLNLKSRTVTLESDLHLRKIRIEYPECGVLLLWMVPGAEYICIEPWENAPDFVDSDMQIINKAGCSSLGPGERKEHIHTITVI